MLWKLTYFVFCKPTTQLSRTPIVAIRVKHGQTSNSNSDQEEAINVEEIIEECINELKKKMKIKDDSSIIHTTDPFLVTSIQKICFPQS